jgi:hypothetical protein
MERNDVVRDISAMVMRYQDVTQAYDEAVRARHGLSITEGMCLSELFHGPQTAGALAAASGLTPAAITAPAAWTWCATLTRRGCAHWNAITVNVLPARRKPSMQSSVASVGNSPVVKRRATAGHLPTNVRTSRRVRLETVRRSES